MSHTYCHTHSKYDCPTCADEILSLGIQVDKDRIKWLESEVARLEACAAQSEPEEKPDFEKLESLGWQIAICAMCGTHASAIKPAQAVAVVGEPVAWVNINKHGDATRTVSRRDNWCTTPVYRKPTNSITAAELATLREKAAEADELRKDVELGECIRVKFRLMKGSTAVRFLGCLGVNEPEGGFDWSKTVLELIDAAIAQEPNK